MKHIRSVLLAMATLFLVSGCFYANVKMPLDTNVDKTAMGQKQEGYWTNPRWEAAWGDASTAAAARNGGLSTVNHMDSELFSILFGIYTESTTIVYGD